MFLWIRPYNETCRVPVEEDFDWFQVYLKSPYGLFHPDCEFAGGALIYEQVRAGRVEQGVEQGVDAAHVEEFVALQLRDEGRKIPRIGDQHVMRAEVGPEQAVRGQ